MSKEPEHTATHADADEPPRGPFLHTVLGWVGVILIFVIILAVTYYPNQAPPVDEARAQERLSVRKDLDATYRGEVAEYKVLDAPNGVYRIPISEAMELIAQESKAAGPVTDGQP